MAEWSMVRKVARQKATTRNKTQIFDTGFCDLAQCRVALKFYSSSFLSDVPDLA